MKCPKCDYDCIENDVAIICPNCDYIKLKEMKWKGETTKCPKCHKEARVYKQTKPGKSFVCDHCNTIGRYLDEKKLKTKIIKKNSDQGKRLAWLFEVPCKYWKQKDTVEGTICPNCELKDVCDAHLEEIDRFCKKKEVEIYLHDDYIEIVHK